jgi:MFS family permease
LSASAAPVAHAAAGSRRYAAYVLAILVLVYIFNFIDRIIVGVLAPPIQAELGLTDTQLGLLGGLAFALLYTGLGIPIAWLADRYNRVWIMTVAFGLWSGFTALCGLAQSFAQLFLARVGVGVGEAGGVAPAYSLISDYFPPSQRGRALAVYAFGIPIGSSLGLVFGGVLATAVDWRTAFIVVGLAGLLLAPVFRATVKEPVRGRLDPGHGGATKPVRAASMRAVLAVLARKPSFWGLAFGASASSIMGYGLIFWMPSFLVRTYGFTLLDSSLILGAIVFAAGVPGIWLGGWFADRLGARGKAAYALVPAVAFLVLLPFQVSAVIWVLPAWALAIFVVPEALRLAWLGPVTASIQHLVPPGMRASASAIFLFINNLIGLGFGTVLIGALSDALAARFAEDSLRYAILIGSTFYLLSAAIFLATSRRLERDWE